MVEAPKTYAAEAPETSAAEAPETCCWSFGSDARRRRRLGRLKRKKAPPKEDEVRRWREKDKCFLFRVYFYINIGFYYFTPRESKWYNNNIYYNNYIIFIYLFNKKILNISYNDSHCHTLYKCLILEDVVDFHIYLFIYNLFI